jgi:hypothetical protein
VGQLNRDKPLYNSLRETLSAFCPRISTLTIITSNDFLTNLPSLVRAASRCLGVCRKPSTDQSQAQSRRGLHGWYIGSLFILSVDKVWIAKDSLSQGGRLCSSVAYACPINPAYTKESSLLYHVSIRAVLILCSQQFYTSSIHTLNPISLNLNTYKANHHFNSQNVKDSHCFRCHW